MSNVYSDIIGFFREAGHALGSGEQAMQAEVSKAITGGAWLGHMALDLVRRGTAVETVEALFVDAGLPLAKDAIEVLRKLLVVVGAVRPEQANPASTIQIPRIG